MAISKKMIKEIKDHFTFFYPIKNNIGVYFSCLNQIRHHISIGTVYLQGKDLSNDIFVVCGSVSKYKCVVNAAKEYSRDVVICFDNDKAGIELGNSLEKELAEL